MKTLDEVIKAFEYTYENDPTAWTYGVDALHYLKKLKRIEAKIEKIAIGNVEDTLSKMDNPLLTWDELKGMQGKPVWVVVDGKERWHIIKEVTNEHLILESRLPIHKCWMNHPNGWQAYRKERV